MYGVGLSKKHLRMTCVFAGPFLQTDHEEMAALQERELQGPGWVLLGAANEG